MNVLVIAPHPDDEAIGCGGAIVRHVRARDAVHVMFLTSGELGLKHMAAEEARQLREGEARAAASVLGVTELSFLRQPDWRLAEDGRLAAEATEALMKRGGFERVYVPHRREWHPDHRTACRIAASAARRAGLQEHALFGYEIWTPLAKWDHVEDVGEAMPVKLEAIRCYRSQLRAFDYERAVRGLNGYRGALAGRCDFAEAFEVSPFEIEADPQ